MKCLVLFSGKNKKNITSLSSAEFAYRVFSITVYKLCLEQGEGY